MKLKQILVVSFSLLLLVLLGFLYFPSKARTAAQPSQASHKAELQVSFWGHQQQHEGRALAQ